MFLFLIIYYILQLTDLNIYLNMISEIQGYKFNFYKNEKNNFTLKNIIISFFGTLTLILYIYYYIIIPKKTIVEGYIFVVIIILTWGSSYIFSFDKAVYYAPLLLYDAFIVGGLSILLSQYIIYNYYNILKKNISLLMIFYLLTNILFFYLCYKYNPN
jgi:hypothetical protein